EAVTVTGQPGVLTVFPGGQHRLGQQRQRPTLDTAQVYVGAKIVEDGVDEPGLKLQTRGSGGTRDRAAQPRPAPPATPKRACPQGVDKLRVGRASAPEVPPDAEYHQRRWLANGPDRRSGRRAQRVKERHPLRSAGLIVTDQGEDLLELVYDQQQSGARPYRLGLTGASGSGKDNLPCDQTGLFRVLGKGATHRCRVQPGQRCQVRG